MLATMSFAREDSNSSLPSIDEAPEERMYDEELEDAGAEEGAEGAGEEGDEEEGDRGEEGVGEEEEGEEEPEIEDGETMTGGGDADVSSGLTSGTSTPSKRSVKVLRTTTVEVVGDKTSTVNKKATGTRSKTLNKASLLSRTDAHAERLQEKKRMLEEKKSFGNTVMRSKAKAAPPRPSTKQRPTAVPPTSPTLSRSLSAKENTPSGRISPSSPAPMVVPSGPVCMPEIALTEAIPNRAEGVPDRIQVDGGRQGGDVSGTYRRCSGDMFSSVVFTTAPRSDVLLEDQAIRFLFKGLTNEWVITEQLAYSAPFLLKNDLGQSLPSIMKTAIWKKGDPLSRTVTAAPSVSLSALPFSPLSSSTLSGSPEASARDEEEVGMDVFSADGKWLGFRRDLRNLSKAEVMGKILLQVEIVLKAMIKDMARRNTDLTPLRAGAGSSISDCAMHVLGQRDTPNGSCNEKITTAYAKPGKAFALAEALKAVLNWRKAIKVKSLGLNRVPVSNKQCDELITSCTRILATLNGGRGELETLIQCAAANVKELEIVAKSLRNNDQRDASMPSSILMVRPDGLTESQACPWKPRGMDFGRRVLSVVGESLSLAVARLCKEESSQVPRLPETSGLEDGQESVDVGAILSHVLAHLPALADACRQNPGVLRANVAFFARVQILLSEQTILSSTQMLEALWDCGIETSEDWHRDEFQKNNTPFIKQQVEKVLLTHIFTRAWQLVCSLPDTLGSQVNICGLQYLYVQSFFDEDRAVLNASTTDIYTPSSTIANDQSSRFGRVSSVQSTTIEEKGNESSSSSNPSTPPLLRRASQPRVSSPLTSFVYSAPSPSTKQAILSETLRQLEYELPSLKAAQAEQAQRIADFETKLAQLTQELVEQKRINATLTDELSQTRARNAELSVKKPPTPLSGFKRIPTN